MCGGLIQTCTMKSKGQLFTGLANAPVQTKLHAFFGIDEETQRQIGTFVVLFSMVEQQLEFVLLTKSREIAVGQIPTTDRMTVSDRFKALRALAEEEPLLLGCVEYAANLGEVLMTARHTVVHGAPMEHGRVEKNRSWFGEVRKRPFSALQIDGTILDSASMVADTLFRQLGSIGAWLSGNFDVATAMEPGETERETAKAAAAVIAEALRNARAA